MRTWLFVASVNGFIAVAAGAFAAHGLGGRLPPEALGWFETGARYQAYHALALLAVAGLATLGGAAARIALAGWSFAAGIVFFSGSLYLLALTGAHWLGMVTPFGGVLFLIGWGALASIGLTPGRAGSERS